MGSWSIYCGVSNITIVDGDELAFIPLKKNEGKYGYSEWIPATLPIFGSYADYGDVSDIEEDVNTKLIESHFGITIQEFVDHFTNRESDEPELDFQNKDELKDWSFMFIDRKVYNFMSDKAFGYGGAGHLDFGNLAILKLLGFKDEGPSTDSRYKYLWSCQGVEFESDGTWMHECKSKEGIYSLHGKYNGLDQYIKIAPELEYLDSKTMWQLYEHLDDRKVKDLVSILGDRWGSDFDDFNMYELAVKAGITDKKTLERYNTTTNLTMLKKYTKDVRTHAKLLSELKTIMHNLYQYSHSLKPYEVYQTPQCGEFEAHQSILEGFAEINKSKVYIDDEE